MNDLGKKQRGKILLVGFCVVKNGKLYFCKTAFKDVCFSLRAHTSLRENKAKQVPEDIYHRNALDFIDIVLEEEFFNPKFFEKICRRIKNFVLVFGIMWYNS